MTTAKKTAQRLDSASIVALGSAAMFGFGPVSVGYFARIARLTDLSSSIRVTTLFFLAVYLVVVLFGLPLRARSYSVVRLWRDLPARSRLLLALAGLSNAISGWCFFDMLGRIDPLSAAVIMALAIVFNFYAARLLLGEEIGLRSNEGRRKWASFALIVLGVLLTSLYSYLTGGGSAGDRVTLLTLLIGFSSSLFAALRTVGVKGAMNSLPDVTAATSVRLAPALALTRFVYLFAFSCTLLVALCITAASPPGSLTLGYLLLPNPFMIELGFVYGAAYALSYVAMSRIEASRMALITRSSIVFTALYMVLAASLFGVGQMPSVVEAPAALLVTAGAYLAARPRRPAAVKAVRAGPDAGGSG